MKLFAFLIISFSFFGEIYSESPEFSEKEKTVVYTHSLNILKEYEGYINQMGITTEQNREAIQSNLESFLELFVNRQVLIFNDLDPSHNLSPFYEAESYVNNLLLWYPDGMRIQIDFENARVGEIIQHDNDIFFLDILASKKIDGNYLNRTINENSENLLFRVAFNKRTGGYGNYKIVGIRNTQSDIIPDYSRNLEEVNAEKLNENDLLKIAEGMKSVMSDYSNFLALIGDPEELEEDKEFYRQSFASLFENQDVKVYNDINPVPENYLLSVADYLSALKTDYPNGIRNISIPVDSAKIGNAIKTEEGDYYAYLNVEKFFSGNYLGKDLFRDMFPITAKIRFEKSGNAFTEFKIQSIDIKTGDFYEPTENAMDFVVPENPISVVTRKGWSIGIEGSYSLSPLENQTINSLSLDYDSHTWDSEPGYGYKAGINIFYFFNNHIGIKSGISYQTYQSSFILDGLFTDSELSRDVNDEDFQKIVEADYDSSLSLSYLKIPLVINYSSSKPGKIGAYLEAGVVFAYKIYAEYNYNGNYKYSGYYPYHPTVIQYLDLRELGFYEEQNIKRTGDLGVGEINISGYASFGLDISLGYFSSLRIGPEVYLGLSDIESGHEYTDIFGKTKTHEPTVLKKYGMKMAYILKL